MSKLVVRNLLERLQVDALLAEGRNPDSMLPDHQIPRLVAGLKAFGGDRDSISRFEAQLRSAASNASSRYERLDRFIPLSEAMAGVHSAAVTLSKKMNLNPIEIRHFGVLFHGRINAMACLDSNPPHEPYVIFDAGILSFIGAVNRALIQLLSEGKGDPLQSVVHNLDSLETVWKRVKLDCRAKATDTIRSAIQNYADIGWAVAPVEEFASRNNTSTVYELWLSPIVWRFIAGHEYAHAILGHLHRRPSSKFAIGGRELTLISPEWQDEFSADTIGASLMVESMFAQQSGAAPRLGGEGQHPFTVDRTLWGIAIFFSAVEGLQKCINYSEGRRCWTEMGGESHPPPSKRLSSVKDSALRGVPPAAPLYPAVVKGVRACDGVSILMEQLFDAVRHQVDFGTGLFSLIRRWFTR